MGLSEGFGSFWGFGDLGRLRDVWSVGLAGLREFGDFFFFGGGGELFVGFFGEVCGHLRIFLWDYGICGSLKARKRCRGFGSRV